MKKWKLDSSKSKISRNFWKDGQRNKKITKKFKLSEVRVRWGTEKKDEPPEHGLTGLEGWRGRGEKGEEY